MKVVNKFFQPISNYNLEKGMLISAKIVKQEATPIDNKNKWAWDDEDYEDVQMYIENSLDDTIL